MSDWYYKLIYCCYNYPQTRISYFKWASSWENLFMPYASNKGADQPVHPHSLISAFVIRCLDSISRFYTRNFKPLASLCSWAGRYESNQVGNPEDRFSRNVAQIICDQFSVHGAWRTAFRSMFIELIWVDEVNFSDDFYYTAKIYRQVPGTEKCLQLFLKTVEFATFWCHIMAFFLSSSGDDLLASLAKHCVS